MSDHNVHPLLDGSRDCLCGGRMPGDGPAEDCPTHGEPRRGHRFTMPGNPFRCIACMRVIYPDGTCSEGCPYDGARDMRIAR